MNILAFDTSTRILSVACCSDAGAFEVQRDLDLKHSEMLFELIDIAVSRCIGDVNSVDCFVIAAGPGSFTGLRIGFAAAKGLSAATGKPIVTVPTLEVYGRGAACADRTVIPVIDARKGRYFTALFLAGRRLSEDRDATLKEIEAMAAPHGRAILTGPQAREVARGLPDDGRFIVDPLHRLGRSAFMAELGGQLHAKGLHADISAGPVYIRASEAELTRGKKDAGTC
jgi:tRNA threonylcarbamoyladenosine biosynthesis protein TsaB